MSYINLMALHTVYRLQCAVPFIAPMNSGSTPVIQDPTLTSAMIGELTRTCTENMRISREYKKVDMACKKVITNLVNKVYYRTLKN